MLIAFTFEHGGGIAVFDTNEKKVCGEILLPNSHDGVIVLQKIGKPVSRKNFNEAKDVMCRQGFLEDQEWHEIKRSSIRVL